MKEQLKAFLAHLRLNRNASPHTIAAYDNDVSQFIGFTAGHRGKRRDQLEPSDFDRPAVRAFLTELYRQQQSRASVARKLSALRTFVRFLRRDGWIENDPIAVVAAPKREQKVPAPLTQLGAELMSMAHRELGEEADHVEAVKVIERMAGEVID